MREAEWLASVDPGAMLSALLGARSTDPVPAHLVDFKASDRRLRMFACACVRLAWQEIDDGSCERAVVAGELYADGKIGVDDLAHARAAANHPGTAGGSPQRLLRQQARDCAGEHLLRYPHARGVGGIMETLTGIWPGHKVRQVALLRDIVGNPFRPEPIRWADGVAYCSPRKCAPWPEGPDPPTDAVMGSLAWSRCRWLTPWVHSLARAAYEDRLPDGTLDSLTLAAVADALEEATCAERVPGKWRRCSVCGELFAATNKYSGCNSPGCDAGDESVPAVKWQTHPIIEHLRSPGPHVRGCWALDLILNRV